VIASLPRPRLVARYRGYDVYRDRTERAIPLVILEPMPGATPP
jgi:hypothetical protein